MSHSRLEGKICKNFAMTYLRLVFRLNDICYLATLDAAADSRDLDRHITGSYGGFICRHGMTIREGPTFTARYLNSYNKYYVDVS